MRCETFDERPKETVMFASLATRASQLAPLTAGVLLIAIISTGCGGDDSSVTSGTPVVPTTQAGGGGSGGEGDGGSGGGDSGGSSGGYGTATVTVSAGTFELQVEEACLISDIGIGAVASSGDTMLTLAGIPGFVTVGFETSPDDIWLVAPTGVVIDGTTMSYSGTASVLAAGVQAEDSPIDVELICDELVPVPGG